MLSDLESGAEIARFADRLLSKAGAYGRFPTPVDDLVAAAGLVEPKQSLLSQLVLDRAPAHVRKAVAALTQKVQAVLDRRTREIHLRPETDLSAGRRGFKKLHETAHHGLPWQRELAYADDDLTLSASTTALFEREANQGAAELLFQRELFARVAADYEVGFAEIVELSQKFGASIHATFRRFVETHRFRVAGLVLEVSPCSTNPLAYRRNEAVHSPAFTERFGPPVVWPQILTPDALDALAAAPQASRGVVHVAAKLNVIGTDECAKAELFNNSYNLFLLLWIPRRRVLVRSKRVLRSPAAP